MLGKISYVLVPLVLLSGFLMVRRTYYLLVEGLREKAIQGVNQLNDGQILQLDIGQPGFRHRIHRRTACR